MNKALAKEPKECFESIQDFAETLERASISEDITAFAQLLLPIEPFASLDTPASSSGDSFSTLPANSPDNWLPPIDHRI